MKHTDKYPASSQQEAEEKLLRATRRSPANSAEELLHELQMYQIELEMQNEQLRQSQIDLEKSRDRYVDFYDFAPVGYVTLNHVGMIEEANLTCATLLGIERSKLAHRRFASFVAPADRDCWQRHFQSTLKQDNKQSCELVFQHENGAHFCANLDCMRLQKEGMKPAVRVVLTDITERKLAEQILRNYTNELALHNLILELISQDVPLSAILDKLTRQIEALHPEIHCMIMLLDKDAIRLRLGAAPSLPDAYKCNIDGLEISGVECTCGEAVRRCTRINMEDLLQNGCKLAQLGNLRSCWTQPILSGEKHVLGTITYYRQPTGLPSAAETSLFDSYANLAKLAIEREHARQISLSEQELKLHQAAARELSFHLHTMREQEKTDIAREIHDDLGGTLTAIKMETYWLAEKLSANTETIPLLEHIESVAKLTDNATNALRRIISGLRPTILDDLGLPAALEWYGEQFNKRTGIECRVNCIVDVGLERKLGKIQSINLFRILQESLTNVTRHSGASRVEVELLCEERDEDGVIMLSITDNGRGMPKNYIVGPSSYGILGMTERVNQLGGKIKFTRPRKGGLCVTVNLPNLAGNTKEKKA